jgi:hypothetical protein
VGGCGFVCWVDCVLLVFCSCGWLWLASALTVFLLALPLLVGCCFACDFIIGCILITFLLVAFMNFVGDVSL